MTINEIFEKLSVLDVKKKRSHEEDYLELVFFKKDIHAWERELKEIMGQALKPFGKKPSGEHGKLAKPYGGIRANQSLYKRNFGKYDVVAMIWPWGNGQHMTLKMALMDNVV
jgi:hypothetical protein